MLPMDAELRNRLIVGLVVALVAVLGVYRSGHTARAADARLDDLMAQVKNPDAAQAEALARDFEYSNTDVHFSAELDKDLEYYGLANVDLELLRQPNEYEHPITSAEPVVIAPGKQRRAGALQVKAKLDKVEYNKGGATIKAMHAMAQLKNVSKSPVAYYIEVRSSDRGDCKVKGTRRHNAMALMPGETAELVVCGGRGGVEILDLQTLEITPLGYVYLSKLPPQAIDLEPSRAQAHHGPRAATRCDGVPTSRIAMAIDAEATSWADVVDFYSRHNCDRLQVPDGYRRAEAPVEQLPVMAGKGG